MKYVAKTICVKKEKAHPFTPFGSVYACQPYISPPHKNIEILQIVRSMLNYFYELRQGCRMWKRGAGQRRAHGTHKDTIDTNIDKSYFFTYIPRLHRKMTTKNDVFHLQTENPSKNVVSFHALGFYGRGSFPLSKGERVN